MSNRNNKRGLVPADPLKTNVTFNKGVAGESSPVGASQEPMNIVANAILAALRELGEDGPVDMIFVGHGPDVPSPGLH